MWTLGLPPKDKVKVNMGGYNRGFDNDRGDYQLKVHDHIAYRYEVIKFLGKGSFGQVVECHDHKTGSRIALKLIRNRKRFKQQGEIEAKILRQLGERGRGGQNGAKSFVVPMIDSITFRNHLCVTFPILDVNLYELIKANKFEGCSLRYVYMYAHQAHT